MHSTQQDGAAISAGTKSPHSATTDETRSGYGTVPGSEFPVALYVSVFAAFAWILAASWLAFAGDGDAELSLGFALVLSAVFFALPLLVFVTARHHSHSRSRPQDDFMATRVEIATGTLSGASVWLQVLLIPAALALAATLIGATSMLVH